MHARGQEDQLIRTLLAPLDEVEPVLYARRGREWQRPLILVAVAGLCLLALAGVAIGAGIGPFAGISAADHKPGAADAVTPKIASQLKADELPGNPVDQIGLHRLDTSRWVGRLPSGRAVYVIGTSKGRLCVVVAQVAESCGQPLTQASPVTFTVAIKGLASEPSYAWGVARDGVVAVSFAVAGRSVTVPVEHNFFAYEGRSSDRAGDFSSPTAIFADGHQVTLR
jgi:hypothetical protein